MKEDKFFGPYQILQKIGVGGFSEVFQVKKDAQFLALKKLRPHLQFDSEYIKVIVTEALLLSKINDPLHFPILFDHGKKEKEHYLVMELIEGMNLKTMIQKSFMSDRLSVPWTCQIVLEICRGVEHLHATDLSLGRPTVHGDLRPSNVMISLKGEVKMIDLGLKGGTFDYMPFERLHDGVVTPYSDIYGMGHILYELLHGRPLFNGKTKAEAYFEMRELEIKEEIFDAEVPLSVRRLLVKSLNQDPSLRYKSATELRNDLENYLSQEGFQAKPVLLGQWLSSLR